MNNTNEKSGSDSFVRSYLKSQFPSYAIYPGRTGAPPGRCWYGNHLRSPGISRRGAGPTFSRTTGVCFWHPIRNFEIGSSQKGKSWLVIGLIGALALTLLAGCAPTNVQQTSENTGSLPRPDLILVYDFAVSPAEVELDETLTDKIKQRYEHLSSTNPTPQELQVGHTVAYVVADEMVKKIRSYGLWAERAMGQPYRRGNTLVIKGQFLSIDEGNRAERVLIGFSAGRTDVEADVQVYELTAAGEQQVEDLTSSGESASKPGMAEMMGVGLLTHHLLTSALVSGTVAGVSEAKLDTVEDDGRRMADKISANLGQYFVSQGWIPPGALKSSSTF